MTRCAGCGRLSFPRARLQYELPPDDVAICVTSHSVECSAFSKTRAPELVKQYRRLAAWQHKAILAFDAGSRPGSRTRNGIASATRAKLGEKP